jgi:membrane protein implicated in regulation of membrane protease activity
MSFSEFITAPNVWPFSLSLLLFFILTGLEIILGLIGIGNEFGLDTDLDVDVEVPESSWLTRAFDWLGMGKVPYLVTLSGFLMLLGLAGLFTQYYCTQWSGGAWPWWLVALGCLFVCFPAMKLVNHLVGKFWPKDVESSAVSRDALIGQEAEITMGDIDGEQAGQIKVRDPHGTTHYVLAVSAMDADRFKPGDPLLVVGRRGSHYIVRRNPLPERSTD